VFFFKSLVLFSRLMLYSSAGAELRPPVTVDVWRRRFSTATVTAESHNS